MTMRKYLVTIHEDGRITADEYEEPKGFVYCSGEAPSVWDDYNQALADVISVLEAEKARCDAHSMCDKFGHDWSANWAGRAIECELLKSSIKKLFRRS